MIKKFLVLFISFYLLIFVSKPAFSADSNFDISVDSTYKIHSDGITTLSQTVRIKNKTEYYYTPTYTINVGFKDIQNIQATNADGSIPTTLIDKNSDTKGIKLTFPKRYAGLGETNTFTLTFDTKDVVKTQGNIKEITIPGITEPESFSSYQVRIQAPDEFGVPSIIKPEIDNKTQLQFSKNEISKGGIYILYGDKQYYSFELTYNISNPNLFPVRTEIALPPQTNYQDVIISSFSSPPLNVTKDKDGNWIAEYRLVPQEKRKVIVKGLIEVFAEPRKEPLLYEKELSLSEKYWDSGDEKVVKIAESLKGPEEIYNYVKNTLSYNYSKVATENLRLGGKGALQDTKNSVCLEFTDLFITLARAKGIPARAVEGYAYTDNARLRPTLSNDILHAWPEYYNKELKKWIMVDPTWGNTTHNIDYFNSLDFQHVAFVIKGLDSEYPIPAGGYKFTKESKDVIIKFSSARDFVKKNKLVITDTFPNFAFPKTSIQGSFEIKNDGNSSVSDLTATVVNGKGIKRQFLIDYIPPGGIKKITTSYNDVPFLTNGKYLITIQVGNAKLTKSIRISFIPELQQLLFIGGIISGSIIIAIVTFHTGSVLVQRRKRKNSVRR